MKFRGPHIILACAFILFNYLAISQEARGSKPKETNTKISGNKYALIVGISDYNESSLDLKYAKNDAILFKDYLLKVEKLPQEHITDLIDEEATALAISIELEKLYNTTKNGDIVYLYFAGHGDVVKKFNKNSGFLLAWDSDTAQNYYGKSGAVPLSEFNDLIAALSAKNVKTVLILDACRSGFLFEDGSKENLETIKAMFQNSTSFLSCGPNQLSYEAENLKHGYFTYYLVLGLMGAADQTIQDNNIQFFELELFLKDNVKNDTNGAQIPEIRNQAATTDIYKPIELEDKTEALKILESSGKIGTVLANRSAITQKQKTYSEVEKQIINKFNEAVMNKNFEGTQESAYQIYLSQVKNKSIGEDVLKQMKNSLLKSVTTSATQLLNEYLGGSELLPPSSEFNKQARNLGIALELIGDKNHSYKEKIFTTKLFLDAYSIVRNNDFESYPIAKSKLKKILKIEPNTAYAHTTLGTIYSDNDKIDSAFYHYNKAHKIIPNWSLPVSSMGYLYFNQYNYNKARDYFQNATKLQGVKRAALANLGTFYQNTGNHLLAEENYRKSLDIDSSYSWVFFKMGDLYMEKGNEKTAKEWYKKIPKEDIYNIDRVNDYIYALDIEKTEADKILKTYLEKEPNYYYAHSQFADFNRRLNYKSKHSIEQIETFELADKSYKKAIALNRSFSWAYYARALLWRDKNVKKAIKFLEKNIKTNPDNCWSYYHYGEFLSNRWLDSDDLGFKNEDDLNKRVKELYSKSISINKYFINAYTGLAKLASNNEIIPTLEELLDKNPKITELWDALGLAYIKSNDFQKAEAAYSQLLDLDNTYAKAFENIAYTKLMLNDLTSAEQFYIKAKTANPERFKDSGWDGYSISKHLIPVAEKYFKEGDLLKASEIYDLSNKLDYSETHLLDLINVKYLLGDHKNIPNNSIVEIKDRAIVNKIEQKYTYKGNEYYTVLELLLKISIDLEDTKTAEHCYEELSKGYYQTSQVLELLYFKFSNDKKSAKNILNNIHPIMLSEEYLSKRYSSKAINILLQ